MKDNKLAESYMKIPYQWVLFDADETLFHFDDFTGLKKMLSSFNVEFTRQDYEFYQAINKPLWVQYQNNVITSEQLHQQRFKHWAEKLGVTSQDLNSAFMTAMADICAPIDGATSLLNALRGKAKMGIITNGFFELQKIRLEYTGLQDYFDILVISEQVGFAKPHRGIFDHALSLMGEPSREHVLMVGDNPDSDILGGINAGLHTCWLNRHGKLLPKGIQPHYQVSSLQALEKLLFK
jgi:5'-nucleotidase